MAFLLQVVDSVYDCKSEVIGPGFFRFKAEIGETLLHNCKTNVEITFILQGCKL